MSTHDLRAPVDALNSLTRGDGTPDVQARREALNSIVVSLSSQEIRNLRSRLNAITFNKDICSNLPVELLLHVAENLNLEDLMVARHVSRAWRDKFSSPDLLLEIIKIHFRTQWERCDMNDSIAKEHLLTWFPKACIKRLRKRRGQYVSISAYHYQRGRRSMLNHRKIEHQYKHGRVAFLFHDSIVVHSLKDGPLARPELYMEQRRMSIRPIQWILSDQFLVSQLSGRLDLIAWALTGGDSHRVILPSTTKYMSARGKHVGLITKSNEVLLWNIGESIVSIELLDRQQSECSSWVPEAVLFHPLHEGHFFVFYVDWPGAGILVQKFIKGNFCRTYRQEFTSESASYTHPYDLDLRIIRDIGWNGICSIGWELSQDIKPSPSSVQTFNMYTCEFGVMEYPSPVLPERLVESALRLSKSEVNFDLKFSLEGNSEERCPSTIYDDDYEIVFGDSGYVVWAFDDTELPVIGSLSDLSLDVAPADRRPL